MKKKGRNKKRRAKGKREEEQEQNVTAGWKRARSHRASWIFATIRVRTDARVYVCVSTYVTVPRDALSNVLFISVEQSLPVYPEDISLVANYIRNALQRFPEPRVTLKASPKFSHIEIREVVTQLPLHADALTILCFYGNYMRRRGNIFPKNSIVRFYFLTF